MKLSECNEKQKKAFINISKAANWHIGGLENALEDYPQDSEEYKSARATLGDHAQLVNDIYEMAISEVYVDGGCFFGSNAQSYLKDIRFCGKDWLMARVEARVKKLGY